MKSNPFKLSKTSHLLTDSFEASSRLVEKTRARKKMVNTKYRIFSMDQLSTRPCTVHQNQWLSVVRCSAACPGKCSCGMWLPGTVPPKPSRRRRPRPHHVVCRAAPGEHDFYIKSDCVAFTNYFFMQLAAQASE